MPSLAGPLKSMKILLGFDAEGWVEAPLTLLVTAFCARLRGSSAMKTQIFECTWPGNSHHFSILVSK